MIMERWREEISELKDNLEAKKRQREGHGEQWGGRD